MYIIGNEEVEAARRVINSQQLFRYRGGEGGETDKFEKEWREKIGTQYALAVTNGTAALTCALVGMGVGPGDEVILPAYTWMATAVAPLSVGAIPILADIDESLTLDPEDLERKITPRTKVICPVHMFGFPSNMDAVMNVAEKHDLLVLEDSCQADGGSYKGKRLGSIGHAGAFSFNYFKIIICGEGGAMVTDDKSLYHKALIYHDAGCGFRKHAKDIEEPIFVGTNYRISEVLSAILRSQVSRLEGILEALRKEKKIMRQELHDESAFVFNPVNDIEGDCSLALSIMFEKKEEAEGFIARMREEKISVDSPINSALHVYTNWEPILKKRGAYHPGRNPYELCGYEVEYTEDMCQQTLELLARTVYIPTKVSRPESELLSVIETVKKVTNSTVPVG